ncbi:LysE family translocator [Actinokineospora globicatena]|uniref:Threonine transporter RhtB n=1 Tax=Actinokineospora globicatena TaxID=103729 RepID=A0A9W6QR21_9PSEU|nr:LysE family translocator [Actinokineospora globicatena]MCP2300833.1 Threonine/homoserine/homoserine lactone efflux protein [Actinokineospora globicatena]GLW77541.1 threonine transporter RhtB [Actinokineospora globicatena]GLW84375.1 threonine transporter RhtB [Actinokineospora globicatena]GLW93039.1 threonine transporter RhtB [Actinokineospora globicatena]
MTWSGFLAFLLASLILAMVPGVGTAMLLRQSIKGGRRGALATVAGMEVGVAVWAVAAAFGLSVLLVASEVAYQALRIGGVAVLLWFGARALFGKHDDSEPVAPTSGSGFRSGLVVNVANPKLAVFAISFLPQFVEPGAPRWVLVALAGVWVLVDTLWYLLVIALLSRIMGWLRRSAVRRRLERVSGAVLIGLGIKLAVQS